MADCTDNFSGFNKTISLLPVERNYLRKARRVITDRIRTNFKSRKQIPAFEFKVQGSYSMGTIVRPLEGDFDLDLGIYFKFPSNNRSEWPIPQTVSGWVLDALKNQTSTTPENKTSCVRVSYKPVVPGKDYGYHIDIPIYGRYTGSMRKSHTVIGFNDERQWDEHSDPTGFTDWFNEKCSKNKDDGKQLVRLVRYLKAWKDFQTGAVNMPSGMIMTVLAGKNYYPKVRDDITLYKMLDEIYFRLWWGFWIEKPTAPENNLVKGISDRKREYFMERLKEFKDDAYTAIHSDSKEEAMKLWRKHFGDRFI